MKIKTLITASALAVCAPSVLALGLTTQCGDSKFVTEISVDEGMTCEVTENLVINGAATSDMYTVSENSMREAALPEGAVASIQVQANCSSGNSRGSISGAAATFDGCAGSLPEPPTVTPTPQPTPVTPGPTPTPNPEVPTDAILDSIERTLDRHAEIVERRAAQAVERIEMLIEMGREDAAERIAERTVMSITRSAQARKDSVMRRTEGRVDAEDLEPLIMAYDARIDAAIASLSTSSEGE